jgi:ketosteroid isomerase-like protein
MTTRAEATRWIDGYETAWRTEGTAGLAELFTEDATYSQGPYHDPVVGLPAIARMWEAERDGPGERFDMVAALVAVEGDTAVARVSVRYHEPAREYLDLWIMRFAGDGRCRAYEEWPFWPDRPTHAG